MSDNFPGNPFDNRNSPSHGTDRVRCAVMALAFEQRTATLLAYLDYVTRMGMTGDALTGPYVQVLRRLGLDEEPDQ